MKTLTKLEQNSEWQRQVSDFVGREIITCASTLIYDLSTDLREDSAYYDDLLNLNYMMDYQTAAEEDAFRKDLSEEERQERIIYLNDYNPEDYCSEYNIEPHEREIFEHWIVSSYLANRLEEKGEKIVRDFFGFTIWGRTTTGQTISMDRVIQEVYYDLVKNDAPIKQLVESLNLNNAQYHLPTVK